MGDMEMMGQWLFIAMVAVLVLALVLQRRMRARMNAGLPIETAVAEVVDRRNVKYCRGRGNYARTIGEYYVTFRPETGMRREFRVGEAEYVAYHLGDRGPLSWQGDTFVSFRPERRVAANHDVPVAFNEEAVE